MTVATRDPLHPDAEQIIGEGIRTVLSGKNKVYSHVEGTELLACRAADIRLLQLYILRGWARGEDALRAERTIEHLRTVYKL